MKFLVIVSIMSGLFLLACPASAEITIDPADPDIRYTGRWEFSDPAQPWSYWIGSSIIVEFTGTGLRAMMTAGESGRADHLRVIVDGDVAGSTKIPVSGTLATYVLASGLPDISHRVEIVKETDVGRWSIQSFGLDDGASLVAQAPRPSLRMVFYGDSNLAGYSLESEQNEGDDELRGAYYGYAGIVSRMCGAEYQNVSRSGATVSSLHGVFDRMDYGSSTPLYDFSGFPPDVVVVNVGANDVGRPVHRIKDDYHAFLDDLRAVHPGIPIVLYNAWGWDYDEPANYTHEVVAERDDPDMSVAIFPWIFEQWHGCEYDHAGMANLLADHLASILGWDHGPSDVMNGFAVYGHLANGDFEKAAPFGGYGWRYFTDAGVNRVNDPGGSYAGDFHLHLADGASVHQPMPASDSQTFSLTAWMRGEENGDEIAVTMDFRDQEMWTTPLQSETLAFVLTTDWQQFTMTATAPFGTVNPVYHTRVTFTAGAGDVVYIDDADMVTVTAVPEGALPPSAGRLHVSPNPFNPRVRIEFSIPTADHVRLSVFDVSGHLVRVLADNPYQAGTFVAIWNGRDDRGQAVGAGTYFARMAAGRITETRKMVLIR